MIRPQFKNGDATVGKILLITKIFVREDENLKGRPFRLVE